MDIVNENLPTGSRIIEKSSRFKNLFPAILSRTTIESSVKSYNGLLDSGADRDIYRYLATFKDFTLLEGNDEFPIVSVSRGNLLTVAPSLSCISSQNKSDYAWESRCNNSGLYMPQKDLKLQWSPRHERVVQYDVPYEGELVNNSPMIINKELNNWVYNRIKELAIEALLSCDDEDLSISYGLKWLSQKEKSIQLGVLLPKLLEEKYTTKELATIAYLSGICGLDTTETNGNKIDPTPNGIPKIQLTSSVRTKLIYYLGGYQLPENYQEWFNG